MSDARRGRPRQTEEQRDARRAALVVRAADAIRARGADLSIDELASACGVSKPVLYDLFGDKVGLADAIAAGLAARVTARVAAALEDPAVDLRGALGAMVDELVDVLEHETALYRFLVTTIRTGDHGFFDSALVGIVRERGAALAAALGPDRLDLADDALRVLTDGAFGFVFFAVESWLAAPRIDREELVRLLSTVITSVITSGLPPAAS